VDDYEAVAQELSALGEKYRLVEERLAEVERVNARLEEAALSTARALGEVSRHWNAVYDAMRRTETVDRGTRPSATTPRVERVEPSAPESGTAANE
jgi:predicted nuclease with TOPRIM domain